MSIKLARAQRLANIGQYPRTWHAIIARIPAEIIEACTARRIAQIADAMRAQFEAGHSAGYRDASA